jgi:hypothetical protein
MQLIGVDFSSAPSRRKPITVAIAAAPAHTAAAPLVVSDILRFQSLDDWQHWLCQPAAWVGAFVFPLGIVSDLVESF